MDLEDINLWISIIKVDAVAFCAWGSADSMSKEIAKELCQEERRRVVSYVRKWTDERRKIKHKKLCCCTSEETKLWR